MVYRDSNGSDCGGMDRRRLLYKKALKNSRRALKGIALALLFGFAIWGLAIMSALLWYFVL